MKQFILQPERTFLHMISELEDEPEVWKRTTHCAEVSSQAQLPPVDATLDPAHPRAIRAH